MSTFTVVVKGMHPVETEDGTTKSTKNTKKGMWLKTIFVSQNLRALRALRGIVFADGIKQHERKSI